MSITSLKKQLNSKKINKHNLNKNANNLLIEYGLYIKKMFPNVRIHLLNNDLYIVTKKDSLHNLAYFLKYHTNSQFKSLIDLGVIDYPQKKNRFELNYFFLSVQYNTRITVVTYTQDSFPVRSLTDIFKSSNWMEREAWDMFGVFFAKHNDLRRILTDYGFKGHPLRKDFPLSGYIEVIYNFFDKKIESKELSLAQAYRNFNLDR